MPRAGIYGGRTAGTTRCAPLDEAAAGGVCGRPRAPIGEPSPALARHAVLPFRPVDTGRRVSGFTAVRGFRGTAAIEAAAARVAQGSIETVLVLSFTALYHRVFFDPRGVWVQRGGLFGRANRDAPLFRLTTLSRRSKRERARIAALRGLDDSYMMVLFPNCLQFNFIGHIRAVILGHTVRQSGPE